MESLHLPDNIKVHFAGAENFSDATLLNEMGINYCLFTAFPFVKGKLSRGTSNIEIPSYLSNNMIHVIQDSGLYPLLFGAYKKKANKEFIYKWYDALIDWTLQHGRPITCVEVDAQSIIGVEETWNLREQMKKNLPNNRIINVWHLQDGLYGLDRLIEFSDYIAIGLPELKSAGKQEYALPIAKYIKNKNKNIDIHLLGFTDFAHIRKFHFCTSCDSTTWINARRFGVIDNFYRIENFDSDKIKNMIGVERYESIKMGRQSININASVINIEFWKHKTTRICGNQNLKWIYNQ